jgi:hypothetical protein
MSDEKKIPVDTAHIRDGDVVKLPHICRGSLLVFAADPKADPYVMGCFTLTVDESDIVRAPVPREVVNVPCEVLGYGECASIGDVIHFRGGEVCVVTINHTIPWSNQYDIDRVLRPIKKP